jgi:hypothetical protein
MQHRVAEWLVNNECGGSESFGLEVIWIATAELFCREWEEPRRMLLNTVNSAKMFEAGDSVNKKQDCSVAFSDLWVR